MSTHRVNAYQPPHQVHPRVGLSVAGVPRIPGIGYWPWIGLGKGVRNAQEALLADFDPRGLTYRSYPSRVVRTRPEGIRDGFSQVFLVRRSDDSGEEGSAAQVLFAGLQGCGVAGGGTFGTLDVLGGGVRYGRPRSAADGEGLPRSTRAWGSIPVCRGRLLSGVQLPPWRQTLDGQGAEKIHQVCVAEAVREAATDAGLDRRRDFTAWPRAAAVGS